VVRFELMKRHGTRHAEHLVSCRLAKEAAWFASARRGCEQG